MIKFTFDVDKVFERLNNKTKINNFSSLKMCEIDYDRLITQREVFDLLKLDENKYKGFCTLVSIYNAFPDIFKNINELGNFIIEQIRQKNKYGSLSKMRKAINKKYHKDFIFNEKNLSKSYRIFTNNISKNKPVVISYDFQHKNMLLPYFGQHTVTLFGYDNDFIYYYENSEDDYLFTSLALYIYSYYKFYGLNKNNFEYDRLSKVLEQTTEEKVYEYSKGILGFNISRHNIRTLKKEFLTNDKYFYNINRLITYNGNIARILPEDNCTSTNKIDFNFSELIQRLNSINK